MKTPSEYNVNIVLRTYREGDVDRISRLMEENYPHTLGAQVIRETWLWQFKNAFSNEKSVAVAEIGSEIIAHYAVMCFDMNYRGTRIIGALSTATVTDRSVRGKGLFRQLAEKVYADLSTEQCSIIFGFPNSQSIRGFIEKLDWFEICPSLST
mgnify:CR=1 FL=1